MQIEGEFRRKLGTACSSCKRRKIRCDISGAGPCTPCQRSGAECSQRELSKSTLRHKRRQKSAHSDATAGSPSAPYTAEGPVHRPSGSHGSVQPLLASPESTRDESLTAFYERAINAREWEVFSQRDPIRIVYVGSSIANLHHLSQSEDPSQILHYPFPATKPKLPWKPDAAQGQSGGYLTAEIAQDLSSFPTRDVRDSLVATYFEDIHPGLPIIDEDEFRRQYDDPSDPPWLLIFHSVLLAAARISDHPMVANARPTVTATLYRRAKTLFELRHENDRVSLIQAALLLAWHVEDSDTIGSGAYYWTGEATRLAYGLGMHRDLSTSRGLMPNGDRRLYRVLWWTVLQSEALTAIEYGRPAMIRYEDYDQPPLKPPDFSNWNETEDKLVRTDFCMLNAQLSEIALDVVALHAPRAPAKDRTGIERRLAALAQQLPTTHDFWSCQLRVNYSLLCLVLHRTGHSVDSEMTAQESASAILTTFETMVADNVIRKCNYNASTALLAAALQFTQTVQSAVLGGSIIRALTSHAQLERLLRPMESLAVYWPHIEALHKLARVLCARCSNLLVGRNMMTSHEVPRAVSEANVDIQWQEIMAGYQLPELTQDLGVEEWMNSL